MTTRTFNYTNCRRIPKADVTIHIDSDDRAASFSAAFDLEEYQLPPDAEVVVEAYVDWTVMRFSFGTVGTPTQPASTELTEFDSVEGVKLRLKILGTGDHAGLILAEADKIQPSAAAEPTSARSFVLVRPTELGAVVWRLTFDEAQPLLQVNERLGDWKSFLGSPGVRSVLLPEVVRQILREAVQRGGDEESESDWPRQCEKLAESLGFSSVPTDEDEDETETWIDNVVRKFALRHRLWNGVTELLGEGEDS